MEAPLSWTTDTINVCIPNECLYPILDSIIAKVNVCPATSKMRNSFRLTLSNVDTIYDDKHDIDSIWTLFAIYNIPGKYFNHKWYTEGVFYYHDVAFYSNDKSNDLFLTPTDSTVVITCIDPEKYPTELIMEARPYMIWDYSYVNGTIICDSYGQCKETGDDGAFYYIIDEDKGYD
jgi:hypothetical protein